MPKYTYWYLGLLDRPLEISELINHLDNDIAQLNFASFSNLASTLRILFSTGHCADLSFQRSTTQFVRFGKCMRQTSVPLFLLSHTRWIWENLGALPIP